MITYTVVSIYLVDRKLLTNKVEPNVHLSSQLSDQLLLHTIYTKCLLHNEMLAHISYNVICKLKVFNQWIIQIFK